MRQPYEIHVPLLILLLACNTNTCNGGYVDGPSRLTQTSGSVRAAVYNIGTSLQWSYAGAGLADDDGIFIQADIMVLVELIIQHLLTCDDIVGSAVRHTPPETGPLTFRLECALVSQEPSGINTRFSSTRDSSDCSRVL